MAVHVGGRGPGHLARVMGLWTPAELFTDGAVGFWFDAAVISTLFQDTSAASPVTASGQTAARANSRPPPTTNAQQDTASARPVYTEDGALRFLNFDGSDDGLFTTLVPDVEVTLAACFRASGPNQVILGASSNAGNNRCYLATDGSGSAGGGWMSQNATTIKGGSSIAGADAVVLMRASASRVNLWLNGQSRYDAAASGSPNTTVPLALGALNNSGTLATFLNGRLHRAFAINRFIADADVLPLMRAIGAGVVSF